MYESFFQFQQRPFAATPRIDRYFPANDIERAVQTLTRCIDRAEGPGLLIGGPGTGKSLVCQLLAARFAGRFHVVSLSDSKLCTRRALLQSILFSVGLPYRGLEEGELRLSLIDFLKPNEQNGEGMLLLIDEAHTLPMRLVEEIRMITNLVRDGQPRVRLVLVGAPALDERFAHPKLESFNQRIAARCYLQQLGYEETLSYVQSQLAAVGADPTHVMTNDAIQAVYQASDGIPRLINQVCDHALMLAAMAQNHCVTASGIEEAWADLQQLPMPWQPPATPGEASAGVIEFGQLDEVDETPVHEPEAVYEELENQESLLPAEGEQAALDLTVQLDAIERQVGECATSVDSDPTPVSASQTADNVNQDLGSRSQRQDRESVESSTNNPFDEPFDEEHVVINRFANDNSEFAYYGPDSRETATALELIYDGKSVDATAERTTDSNNEESVLVSASHAIAEQSQAEASQATVDELAIVAKTATRAEEHVAGVREHDEQERDAAGSCETDYREVEPAADAADAATEDEARVRVFRVPPPDDSDIILVLDDDSRRKKKVLGDAEGSSRHEYRRLFSKLRQESQ